MKKIVFIFLIILFNLNIDINAQIVSGVADETKKPRIERKYERVNIIMIGASIHPSQLAYTLTYANVKKFGYYAKLKTNFNFNMSADHTFDEDRYYGNQLGVFYSGKKQTGRIAATVGGIWNMTTPLMLYLGAGYGQRWCYYETLNGETVQEYEGKISGIEYELGLILRIKHIALSAGFGMINDKWGETNVAVGYIF